MTSRLTHSPLFGMTLGTLMVLGLTIALVPGCSSPESRQDRIYRDFLEKHQEKGWVEITPEVVDNLREAWQAKRERELANHGTEFVETLAEFEDSGAEFAETVAEFENFDTEQNDDPSTQPEEGVPDEGAVILEPMIGGQEDESRIEPKDGEPEEDQATHLVADQTEKTEAEDSAEQGGVVKEQPPSPQPPSDEFDLTPENTRTSRHARNASSDAKPDHLKATEGHAAADAVSNDGPGNRAESLELRSIPLTDMIRLVAREVGMDIIVPDGLDQRVTLSLRDTEPLVALNSVLAANGFEIVEQIDGLFVVQQIDEKSVPLQTRAFTLTSLPVQKIESDLKSILSPEGKIVLNIKGNTFLMLDRPDNIELMEDFVRLLDIRERQVLVEATIMEIRLESNDQIGMLLEFLDVNLDDVTGTFGQSLLPTDRAFTIDLLSDNDPFRGVLEAIATTEALNILSTPKVATLNGEVATIEVIEKIPYIDTTATTSTQTGGIGNTTVQQVEFEEVGITLTILPTIGDDDVIKLKVTSEVIELRSFFLGVPVTAHRKVDTTVLVRDGGAIVIGGLLRENEFESERKVPFLGDLPLIGALFRFRQRRMEKNELLILISPHIIDADETQSVKHGREAVEQTKRKFKRGGPKRAGQLIW